MNKNNLIRFVQSLVLLPMMTGTTAVPLGSILMENAKDTVQTVFIQKNSLETGKILVLDRALDEKALDLKKKADAIDAYFEDHDMPLLGEGKKMAEEAEENGLDWRLLAAISIRESTGGKNDCKKADNNPFGWGSCKISFDSVDEAIETVAINLGGNNPNTEKHYAGKNLKEILRAYNPPHIVPRYAEQVISIMNAIGPEEFMPTKADNTEVTYLDH